MPSGRSTKRRWVQCTKPAVISEGVLMLASTVAWGEDGAQFISGVTLLMRFRRKLWDNQSTGHVWHIRMLTEHNGDCTGVLDQSKMKGHHKICMQLQLDIYEAPNCWLDQVLCWIMASSFTRQCDVLGVGEAVWRISWNQNLSQNKLIHSSWKTD